MVSPCGLIWPMMFFGGQARYSQQDERSVNPGSGGLRPYAYRFLVFGTLGDGLANRATSRWISSPVEVRGVRSPRSQWRRVPALMANFAANCYWVKPVRRRTSFTSTDGGTWSFTPAAYLAGICRPSLTVARITEGECFYAAAAKGLNPMFLAWRGARPLQAARWRKSVDRAVASPQQGECEASVLPPAPCSGA